MQSSVVAPPPPVQIFRHPFPSFLPYGQYLSPYFMPHQFLSPNGLPQQPSTGNLYLPSAAAAAGVKFPLSQFKAGTNAGNPPHIGIASGYGSYGSSPVGGFNPISSGTSGKSTSNEDLAASQLKDNHIYTTRPLVCFCSFCCFSFVHSFYLLFIKIYCVILAYVLSLEPR